MRRRRRAWHGDHEMGCRSARSCGYRKPCRGAGHPLIGQIASVESRGSSPPTRLRRQREQGESGTPRRCLRACRQAKIGTNSRTFALLYLSSGCLAAWLIRSSRCPSNSSISCSLSLGKGSLIDSSSGLTRSWATPSCLFREGRDAFLPSMVPTAQVGPRNLYAFSTTGSPCGAGSRCAGRCQAGEELQRRGMNRRSSGSVTFET